MKAKIIPTEVNVNCTPDEYKFNGCDEKRYFSLNFERVRKWMTDYESRQKHSRTRRMIAVVATLVLVAIAALLSGCTAVKYVPVESVRTEIEYRDRWQRDSIHVRDSVVVQGKGDTVFVDRWHTYYKDRLLRDTTYIYKTDSVQVPYPVEKALTRWQSVKQEIGGIAMGGIIALCLIIVWLIRKNKKR